MCSSFRVEVPDNELVDLRRRIAATRWPDKETVADRSQGAQLARIHDLAGYWEKGYDWHKAEGRLNALPQFLTEIDGLDVHFIHVSRHQGALPLVMTHGWPGSIFGLLKVIGPLTDPTAYGGRPEDAFDLVLPSMPGYGFSQRPEGTGWNPDRIARAWDQLMHRLGYNRYVAQGGDWGSALLGEQRQQLQRRGHLHSGGGDAVPGEIYEAPRSWAEGAYKKLIYFNKVDKGGHFAAWEQPEILAAEVRAAFRSLR